MQTATQAANSVLSSVSSKPLTTETASESKSGSVSKGRLSESLLDNFWLRMAGMFGHTWTSQYGAAPQGIGGDTWAAALSGVSGEQIAAGLKATLLLASDFPPSAPRFRALCFGIPSLGQVRVELMPGHPSPSRFARMVWSFVDSWRYRQSSESKQDAMLREAYELARDAVMRGEPLPAEPVAAIEAPEEKAFTPARPETVAEAAARIAAALGTPEKPKESTAPVALSAAEMLAVEEELRRQAFDRKRAAAGEREDDEVEA